ncbi:hypothetical protein [Nocardia sp. NPDC003726]
MIGSLLITERAADQAAGGRDPDDILHLVGWLEDLKSRAMRGFPRALCGERLVGDPDAPDLLDPNTPICQRCIDINGSKSSVLLRRLHWVPGRSRPWNQPEIGDCH